MTTPYLTVLPSITTEPRDDDAGLAADIAAMTREEELLASLQHVRNERDALARKLDVMTRYATSLRDLHADAADFIDECVTLAKDVRAAASESDLALRMAASMLVDKLLRVPARRDECEVSR